MAKDYRKFVIHNAPSMYTAGQEFDAEGYFKSTRFQNPDTGFVIGTFCPKQGDEIVCKGEVPGFVLGAPYHIAGKIIEDPNWGIQVNIRSCAAATPTTKEEIVAFLGSGAIPGIGPVTAKRIYKLFGDDTLAILEAHPERLTEVSGIGDKTVKKMIKTLPVMLKYHDVIGYFAQFGISTKTINRLIEEYGMRTKEVVKENPYVLCKVRGFAFSRADSIALKMGISRSDPNRLYAGVLSVLRWACDNRGHTLMPVEDLLSLTMEKLGTENYELVREAFDKLVDDEQIMLDERGAHLKYLYYAEENIKKSLAKAVKEDELVDRDTVDAVADVISRRTGIKLTDEQMEAVYKAYSKKVSIMTGGAGTGKTASCRMVVEVAKDLGIPICLVSPTGRAAKHLSEVCGLPGYTIHRALSIIVKEEKTDDFFSDDETKTSMRTDAQTDAVRAFRKAKLVIADEASMMDTEMAAIVFKACHDKHLMLVGDPNQLPSVGPGRVLGDLLESSYADIVVTRLTKIFRQKDGSPVIDAANAVLAGESPCYVPGITFLEADNVHVPDQIDNNVIPEIYERKLGNTDVMILSPMKKTPYSGVFALNEFLRPKLNPKYRKPDNPKKDFLLQPGDYVMQIKNNYEVDIYNGDIGVVDYVDGEGNVGIIFSDSDDLIEYEPDEAQEQLLLNYAMSIHKSQGSQCDTVAVVLTNAHYAMLNRNLLYTAITRTANKLILIGEKKAFAMAAHNAKESNRMTGLKGI